MGVLIAACSSRAHRVFIVFLDPLFSRRSDLLDFGNARLIRCDRSPELFDEGAQPAEFSRARQA
jgi:hypothetical protein